MLRQGLVSSQRDLSGSVVPRPPSTPGPSLPRSPRPSAASEHHYTAQRVLRTLEIIALRPTTAPAVAAAIGVHPRTARRLLRTLAKEQYVDRRGGSARTVYEYQPTVRLLALASQLAARLPLVRHGQRAVDDLEQQTELTAYLAVPSYAEVLVIACAGKCALRPWDKLPALADAAGRMLLAHREPWRLSVAADQPARALGNAEAASIVERGHVLLAADAKQACSLAVAVPAADPPIAALGLRGPRTDLLAGANRLLELLHRTAAQLGAAETAAT